MTFTKYGQSSDVPHVQRANLNLMKKNSLNMVPACVYTGWDDDFTDVRMFLCTFVGHVTQNGKMYQYSAQKHV